MGRISKKKSTAVNKSAVSRILKQHFSKKKKEQPKFSLRSLANDLNISHGYISQIFNGKRNMPAQKFDAFCEYLDIDNEIQELLLSELLKIQGWQRAPRKDLLDEKGDSFSSSRSWTSALTTSFDLLENWFYIPILDATRLSEYDGSADFLSRRLGLTISVVRAALDRLEREGFIEVDERGSRVKVDDLLAFHSRSNVRNIRSFQLQMLEKTQNTIRFKQSETDVDKRLIISFTHTVARKHIPVMKKKIAEMLRDLSVEAGETLPEDVYVLGAYLLPLTEES